METQEEHPQQLIEVIINDPLSGIHPVLRERFDLARVQLQNIQQHASRSESLIFTSDLLSLLVQVIMEREEVSITELFLT